MYMTVWWLTPILPLLVAVAHVLPCAWVWRRAERRGECVELLHLVQATIVVVALLLVEILVGAYVIGFLQLFGIARLLFYHGAITAPLAGALLLFGSRRQRLWALSRPVQSLALAAILCAPLGAWMRFGAPHRLVLEEVTVPARAGAPPTREPITVGVLADLQTDHVGTHERAAVGRLMAQEPDLIVVPGDVYDGPDVREVMPELRDLLAELEAPGGVWLVGGDHDTPHSLAQLRTGTSMRLLEDRIERVEVRGRRVWVGGASVRWGEEAPRRMIQRLHERGADEDTRLLVAHRPDAVTALPPDSRVDLTVAGHTHGGQIVVPLVGPLVTFSELPRHIGAGGLHEVEGNPLYISRGVGLVRWDAPRVRLFCPPEISVVTLE